MSIGFCADQGSSSQCSLFLLGVFVVVFGGTLGTQLAVDLGALRFLELLSLTAMSFSCFSEAWLICALFGRVCIGFVEQWVLGG